MKYLLLTSAAVLLIPAVAPKIAHAQEGGNSIVIIQEDGSKVVVPLDSAEPVLPGGAAPPMQDVPERRAPEIIPQPSPDIEKREIEVQDKRFDPVTGQEEIGPAKTETREVAPVEAVPAKSAEPVKGDAPKAEAPKEEKKSKKKKIAEKAAASKPAPPKVAGQYEFEIPPGTVIDERLASSIAMDAAPAAAGYTISKHSYNGANVFVVTFKTDNGPYDVLVDAATGKVVLAAYVDEPAVPTAPGHLPRDWEPYTPQPVGKP